MVYVAGWNEGATHQEVIDGKTGARSYPSGLAAPSGWFISDHRGYSATGNDEKQSPGSISEPPAEDPGVSASAFDLAFTRPTNDFGDRVTNALEYSGNLSYLGTGTWRQAEQWTLRGTYWILNYTTPAPSDWETAAGAPPREEWPEWADGVEIDYSLNVHDRITLLSAKAMGSLDIDWCLFLKAPNVTDPWFAANGEPGEPVGSSKLLKVPDSGAAVSVSDLNGFIAEVKAGTPPAANDVRLPSGAIAYDGPWPGDFAGPASTYTYDSHEGAVVLTYRYPAWRYWSWEPIPVEPLLIVPPRRIFPRDDGLKGGAPRTYPPSKGVQSSNRIVGGYL